MSLQRQLRVLDGKESVKGLRMAFATDDIRLVNQHFGSSERFAIYAVDEHDCVLIEVVEFGKLARDGDENKLLEKLITLEHCAAVYCQAIGGSAVRQLMQIGVQPMKVPDGTAISYLLQQLQRELREGPTGWLGRAYGRVAQEKPAGRFETMESEGWVE